VNRMIAFLKQETVLTAALILAAVSAVFAPPDREYLSYCNMPVLSLLFCLMTIVAGLRKSGLFEKLAGEVTGRVHTQRGLLFVLCGLCFGFSALITNDVALITFVPFSLILLQKQEESAVIFAVVMETVSANLGSLLTPIGNPQNLYLYTYYQMTPAAFFRITLPLGLLSMILTAAVLLCRPNVPLQVTAASSPAPVKKSLLALYGGLFALCLFTVLKLVPYWVTLLVVTAAVCTKDRSLFKQVDYILLATFVCFFIFVGNAARIPLVHTVIAHLLTGREILASALLSQCISNVPAAALLSAFTEKGAALVVGTNIGGLGTLIASMASLISYRQISAVRHIRKNRYLLAFSKVNFGLLFVLLGVCSLMKI